MKSMELAAARGRALRTRILHNARVDDRFRSQLTRVGIGSRQFLKYRFDAFDRRVGKIGKNS